MRFSFFVSERFCSQIFGPVFARKAEKQHLWLFSSPNNLHSSVARAPNGMNQPSDSLLRAECMHVFNWTTLAFRLCSLLSDLTDEVLD